MNSVCIKSGRAHHQHSLILSGLLCFHGQEVQVRLPAQVLDTRGPGGPALVQQCGAGVPGDGRRLRPPPGHRLRPPRHDPRQVPLAQRHRALQHAPRLRHGAAEGGVRRDVHRPLHGGRQVTRKFNIRGRTPTRPSPTNGFHPRMNCAVVFLAATAPERLCASLMTHSAVRPEVLENYLGNNGP